MTHDWLALRLEAPLMAFGGEAVDQVGPTRDFPAASALVGLMANALGWHWRDAERHQHLQDRMVFASAILREGDRLTDSQNAQLAANDRGWTTRGDAEGRDGGANTYKSPHRRRRDYIADGALLVVLRLDPTDEPPTLNDLEAAFDRPARPLFIGRKSCLPSRPILAGRVMAASATEALRELGGSGHRAAWPVGEGPAGDRATDLTDRRNWLTGLHGGARRVIEGRLP
ncbi:MAG: type I-E CRISPR-associated protein Cas5/CasD [Maritimibacter sp.]|nr:type I-E CRISPR-associated protein Cas5/CasD [Maritimibacter sp.]